MSEQEKVSGSPKRDKTKRKEYRNKKMRKRNTGRRLTNNNKNTNCGGGRSESRKDIKPFLSCVCVSDVA